MPRPLAALAALLGLAPLAPAQDMPLSQILIEGEGWRKVEPMPKKPADADSRVTQTGGSVVGEYSFSTHQVRTTGGKAYWVNPPLRPLRPGPDFKPWHTFTPKVAATDGSGTLFVGPEEGRHVWVMPSGRDTTKVGGREVAVAKVAFPYCSLRVPRGKEMIAVTGLAADEDGRIYAATEIGVQVFDPTGRLCGVLTPAAPGRPELMAFEGDQLTLWVGDTKYARKLNTTEVK
jgi:sugar lactone lactonase YvrE